LIYGLLAIADIFLLAKFARKGPEEDTSGTAGPSLNHGGA
jgi:hypothetical protein